VLTRQGWEVYGVKRLSGATAGCVDKYYLSPSGKRLRSRTEVTNYLQQGTVKSRGGKDERERKEVKRKDPPTRSTTRIQYPRTDQQRPTAKEAFKGLSRCGILVLHA
jgi:hypothetical protein